MSLQNNTLFSGILQAFFNKNLCVKIVDIITFMCYNLYCIKIVRRGVFVVMSSVRLKENESLESALRRFKRDIAKAGIMGEVRKREHYEKPSVKRKKKSEAARKRKYN